MTVDQAIQIVNSAAQIALSRYGQERGELKADGTWVTETDRLVENFIRDRCSELLGNDAGIFGEEGGWSGAESARHVVIIDPIEGTAPYREKIPVWGVSVAIFSEGKPRLGLFSMPAANHFFVGEFGLGANLDGEPLTMQAETGPIPPTSYLGVSSDAHHWNIAAYPGKIRAFGASGTHVALVAANVLQAALLTRFSFYDIAAAAIVLWSAGGALYYLSGEPVLPEEIIAVRKPKGPVLACHPDSFEETRSYLKSS
ncbi:MAG: hypothetical protein DMF61_10805 [Blastocatellia bacterium AA13]|nr:MAG: hypothetical protein DMF61_10805 [Blastocatellia bacterium AA13]